MRLSLMMGRSVLPLYRCRNKGAMISVTCQGGHAQRKTRLATIRFLEDLCAIEGFSRFGVRHE